MDPTQEPMSVDTFVALVMLAVIAGAALLYAGSKLYFWMATGSWNVSSLPDTDERDYVTSGEQGHTPGDRVSAGGKAETVKTEETETPRNAPAPPLSFDVNAFRQEVRAAALGSLLAHGLLKDGKRTEAMRAVFGKVSGDAYTRTAAAVKRHEQQIAATLPEQAADPPEPAPRLVPIAGGREGHFEL
jgi:hypothetical protein